MNFSLKKVRKLVSDDNLEEALELLSYSMRHRNEIAMLKGYLKNTKKLIRTNQISYAEAQIELNKVRFAILEITENLEKRNYRVLKGIKYSMLFFSILASMVLFYIFLYDKNDITFDADSPNLNILILPFYKMNNTKNSDYSWPIFMRLKEEVKKNGLSISIKYSKDAIVLTEDDAKKIGKKANADLVIWGDSEDMQNIAGKIHIRYYVITEKYIPLNASEGSVGPHSLREINLLKEGAFQTQIDNLIFWMIGFHEQRKGDYQKALNNFNKLTIDTFNHNLSREAYIRIGESYYELGEIHKSLSFFEIARDSFQYVNKRDSILLIKIYDNIAISMCELGKYEDALLYNNLALNISIKYKDSLLMASCYNDIALTYKDLSKLDTVYPLLLKSLKIRESILDKNDFLMSVSYNNIGFFLMEVKDSICQSEKYLRKALYIKKRVLGNSHPKVAVVLNNIAGVYFRRNYIDSALVYFFEVKKIQDSKLNIDNPDLALTLNNIGALYNEKGDYGSALLYLYKSLNIRQKIKDSLGIAQTSNNLAFSYNRLSKFDSALVYHHLSMRIRESKRPQPSSLSTSYQYFAETLDSLERNKKPVKKGYRSSLYYEKAKQKGYVKKSFKKIVCE